MNQLMIHVERIVRPVRTAASRKLKIRRELLAHLEAVVEEEKAGGRSEEASVERAKERLGDPAVLTSQLEASVPLLERLLMSRLPLGKSVDRWEQKTSYALYGPGSATFKHAGILVAMALLLTYVPWFSRRWILVNPPAALVTILVGQGIILLFAYRFAFDIAMLPEHRNKARVWQCAALILMLHAVLRLVVYDETHGRGHLFDSLTTTIHTVGVVSLYMMITAPMLYLTARVGKLVAASRAPYDEWSAIDIAA